MLKQAVHGFEHLPDRLRIVFAPATDADFRQPRFPGVAQVALAHDELGGPRGLAVERADEGWHELVPGYHFRKRAVDHGHGPHLLAFDVRHAEEPHRPIVVRKLVVAGRSILAPAQADLPRFAPRGE